MEIKIYYNDVTLGDPAVVKPNCPSIRMPIEEAKAYAKGKIATGEWSVYLIPDLFEGSVLFQDGNEE
jgi:hypothetical protein